MKYSALCTQTGFKCLKEKIKSCHQGVNDVRYTLYDYGKERFLPEKSKPDALHMQSRAVYGKDSGSDPDRNKTAQANDHFEQWKGMALSRSGSL